jgi:hypothetical protein
MVMGVLEGGKLENLEVESERVTIVMWENWLLVRRAWRIAVPMLPLACTVFLLVGDDREKNVSFLGYDDSEVRWSD